MAAHEIDLLALQEVPDAGGSNFVEAVGAKIGLPYVSYWGVGADDGSGIATLSRWPISRERRYVASAPSFDLTPSRTGLQIHQKGTLSVEVASPIGKITFASLHLLPFHIFGLPDDHPEASRLWSSLAADAFRDVASAIIAGDFNGPVAMRMNSRLRAAGMASAMLGLGTRTDGRSHDDILFGPTFASQRSFVFETASDHHLCVTSLVYRGSLRS